MSQEQSNQTADQVNQSPSESGSEQQSTTTKAVALSQLEHSENCQLTSSGCSCLASPPVSPLSYQERTPIKQPNTNTSNNRELVKVNTSKVAKRHNNNSQLEKKNEQFKSQGDKSRPLPKYDSTFFGPYVSKTNVETTSGGNRPENKRKETKRPSSAPVRTLMEQLGLRRSAPKSVLRLYSLSRRKSADANAADKNKSPDGVNQAKGGPLKVETARCKAELSQSSSNDEPAIFSANLTKQPDPALNMNPSKVTFVKCTDSSGSDATKNDPSSDQAEPGAESNDLSESKQPGSDDNEVAPNVLHSTTDADSSQDKTLTEVKNETLALDESASSSASGQNQNLNDDATEDSSNSGSDDIGSANEVKSNKKKQFKIPRFDNPYFCPTPNPWSDYDWTPVEKAKKKKKQEKDEIESKRKKRSRK